MTRDPRRPLELIITNRNRSEHLSRAQIKSVAPPSGQTVNICLKTTYNPLILLKGAKGALTVLETPALFGALFVCRRLPSWGVLDECP